MKIFNLFNNIYCNYFCFKKNNKVTFVDAFLMISTISGELASPTFVTSSSLNSYHSSLLLNDTLLYDKKCPLPPTPVCRAKLIRWY